MTTTFRRYRTPGVSIFAAVLSLASAAAQTPDYPNREIRFVNGYTAGAGADVNARIVGKHLEEALGKPVIIENKPGALTNVAAAYVARAKPDGYTLFFAGHSTFAMNAYLFKQLPFDPANDFTYVAPTGTISFGIAVGPNSPAKSIKDLVAYLKQKGDKATYGYPNTFALVVSESFKSRTGAPGLAVPYKNPGDALNELNRGDIDFLVYDMGTLNQQEQGGRLRVLAVTSAERSALRPDIPGMREAGIPDFDLGAWFGVFMPANAPQEIVDRLSGILKRLWDNEEKRKTLALQAVEPFFLTPKQYFDFAAGERDKWGKVIGLAKIEKQ